MNPMSIFACTIVSAIGINGHVWNANNEDGPFGIANFINVYPKSENNTYGYYTLSYLSPRYGQSGQIQGGTNEAGLTFDFNAIDRVKSFDPKSKKAFPNGDNSILTHILATMSSVEEVVDFFKIYWFQSGFTSAQMHVADKHGRFAIISASGIKFAEKGKPLVSTNFDICGNEESSSCWRYPIAMAKLNTLDANLSTMISICKATAQKNGGTMYSNIQNLTTGELWFFSKHDPNILAKTTIKDLLDKGQKSYSFSDLSAINKSNTEYKWIKSNPIEIEEKTLNTYVGTYKNSFIGTVEIVKLENAIELSFVDGQKIAMQPSASNVFFFPYEDIRVKFEKDTQKNRIKLCLYENGKWSMTAWKDMQR